MGTLSDRRFGILKVFRFVSLMAVSVAPSFGEDIIIPLEGGNVILAHPQFIRVDRYGSYIPELSFRITNQTATWWTAIKLQFDIGGLCNGDPRQWSVPVVISVGWRRGEPVSNEYTDDVIPLMGNIDGCKTEVIKATLVLAENQKVHIDGVTGERVDLEKQLQAIKIERAGEEGARADEAAAKVKEELKAADEQAKIDAAVELRRERNRKQIAAEQKKRDAELFARYAKAKAERDAQDAAERARIRAACGAIYRNTADMKVKDLTVKEEQRVRACQALGLYPPQ